MAQEWTTGKVPMLDSNGRIPDDFVPQAMLDAEQTVTQGVTDMATALGTASAHAEAAETAKSLAEEYKEAAELAATNALLVPTVEAVSIPAGEGAYAEVSGEMPNIHTKIYVPRCQHADYITVGPGRPDLPATTGYTAAELNSKPIGHEYRSLDGTQGAWVWRKTGARSWIVADGVTDRITIPAHALLNGWAAGSGLTIQRVAASGYSRVHLYAEFAGFDQSLRGGTAIPVISLPDSLRYVRNYGMLGTLEGGGSLSLVARDMGDVLVQIISEAPYYTGEVSWCCVEAWPVSTDPAVLWPEP